MLSLGAGVTEERDCVSAFDFEKKKKMRLVLSQSEVLVPI